MKLRITLIYDAFLLTNTLGTLMYTVEGNVDVCGNFIFYEHRCLKPAATFRICGYAYVCSFVNW